MDWLYENEKPLDMSDVDEEAFNNASHCHLCEEKFMSKEKPDHQHHLVVLQDLLVANKFDIDRIPSLSKVKKQKRLVSRDLHPDGVGSERVEELKQFLNMNKELEDYLVEHELFADDETNELLEDEDHLAMEEIERIVKKGMRS